MRVAGELADGLVGHPSWSVDWARAADQRAVRRRPVGLRAGHARDVEINLWHVVAPNPDVAESVNDAKRHVALYGSIAQYQPYFAANGFGAEAAGPGRCGGVRRAGPRRAWCPTRWPARSSSAARPSEVAAQLAPLWDVADSLCLQPPPVPGEQRRAYDARIAETFYA